VYILKDRTILNLYLITWGGTHTLSGRLCYFWNTRRWTKSRDSSVGIALGYELHDLGSRVRFPAGTGNFSLHHGAQNGSGAHPTSYPMGTRGSFPGGKAAGAWSWPLTSTPQYTFMAWCSVKAQGQLHLHLYLLLSHYTRGFSSSMWRSISDHSWRITSKSTLMIPNNFVYVWRYPW
jgi:hypothetical protein